MRIESSELAFHATHQRRDAASERVELETWRAPAAAPRPDTLSLSERAIAASALPSPCVDDAQGDSGVSLQLSVVKQVLEDLLGIRITVYRPEDYAPDAQPETVSDAAAMQQPPRRAPTTGEGFELRRLRTREESEQLRVSAQGVVRTQDGREIRIDLLLELQREFRQTEELVVRGGSEAPRRKDPLVINLSSNTASFESQRIAFDLDADGVAEQIPNVTAASGFLALDRSGNGVIDNGSELFGARSGDGFAELAALDDDGNGWIDETDAAYAQLRVWRRDAEGQDQLQNLSEAGVGAIHLGQARGAFEMRDAEQNAIAEVRGTGVYLKENGSAGSLQQLDFFV